MKKRLLLCAVLFAMIAPVWADKKPNKKYCRWYANIEARHYDYALSGVAEGAVKGAIVGGLVGDSSDAAITGAALGAIAGGARQERKREKVYKRAYRHCMDSRRKPRPRHYD